MSRTILILLSAKAVEIVLNITCPVSILSLSRRTHVYDMSNVIIGICVITHISIVSISVSVLAKNLPDKTSTTSKIEFAIIFVLFLTMSFLFLGVDQLVLTENQDRDSILIVHARTLALRIKGY